jgi:hypothetical protein
MPVGVNFDTCPLDGVQHIGTASRGLAASFACTFFAVLGSAGIIDHRLVAFQAKTSLPCLAVRDGSRMSS